MKSFQIQLFPILHLIDHQLKAIWLMKAMISRYGQPILMNVSEKTLKTMKSTIPQEKEVIQTQRGIRNLVLLNQNSFDFLL